MTISQCTIGVRANYPLVDYVVANSPELSLVVLNDMFFVNSRPQTEVYHHANNNHARPHRLSEIVRYLYWLSHNPKQLAIIETASFEPHKVYPKVGSVYDKLTLLHVLQLLFARQHPPSRIDPPERDHWQYLIAQSRFLQFVTGVDNDTV